MSDASELLKARAARALREWKSPDARKMREADKREALANGRWKRKRRKQIDRGTADALPSSKPKKMSGQVTAVARGAKRLLTPVEHFMLVEGELVYLGGTSTFTRLGPGRAATDVFCSGEDERRAEFVWAAAVLYLDLLAVYRALKVAARTSRQADALLARWPHFDQRPVVTEMLARDENWEAIFEALRKLPRPTPPPELERVLSLVRLIGHGAHLMDADVATLDLDEDEHEIVRGRGRTMRDLPDHVRRRLFRRRDPQLYVRRVPALPRQRAGRTNDRMGTALTDILFAEHSISRRFSHVPDAPRRALDVASTEQLATLYSAGPQKAALAAVGIILDRSAGVVRGLVQKAKVLGLIGPENTRQAE